HLRNRVIESLENAEPECSAGGRQPMLTFVVAGGGIAGVETVAAINDFAKDALRFYPELSERQINMILVHPGPVILPELGEQLGAYAQKKLAERGVDIRVNTRVTAAHDGVVELSDGTTIPSSTLIWTAGVAPNPLLASLPCPKERGKVSVNEFLAMPEWPDV